MIYYRVATVKLHKDCDCGCFIPLVNKRSDASDKDLCCLKCHHCFDGDLRLLLDNGQFVLMKHLTAGQRILTGKSESYF